MEAISQLGNLQCVDVCLGSRRVSAQWIRTSAKVKAAFSVLIPPDYSAHYSYLSEPPNPNSLPFSRRWVLCFGMHVVVLAAPFASHFAPHQLGLNVTKDFPQVTRLIPALDATQPATNEHELPNLMGIAEPPCAAALSPSTSIGHGQK